MNQCANLPTELTTAMFDSEGYFSDCDSFHALAKMTKLGYHAKVKTKMKQKFQINVKMKLKIKTEMKIKIKLKVKNKNIKN